jgi:hypothetical protein
MQKFWVERTFKNDGEDDTRETVQIDADSGLEAEEEARRGLENVSVKIVRQSSADRDRQAQS